MDLGNISLGKDEINAGGINIPLIKGDKRRTRYSGSARYSRNTRRETEKQEQVM